MEYNIYCDESSHLEHDKSTHMGIGCIYCPKEKLKEINSRIKEIKLKYNVKKDAEIKWTKVSKTKKEMYIELINYFFDDDDIHFRCIIAEKKQLNHEKNNQNHDDWFHKMYFNMLKIIFNPIDVYNVYIDIKDTHSYDKITKLHEIICNNNYDFNRHIVKKMQPVRSEEIQIMQLTDVILGAICYKNRNLNTSTSKLDIVNLIKRRSNYNLTSSTLYRESKLNVFIWKGKDYE